MLLRRTRDSLPAQLWPVNFFFNLRGNRARLSRSAALRTTLVCVANASLPREGLRRPTMRDVAEASGVSLKTVSRVVNDEAGVSTATAERVRRSISQLGFRRNDIAHSLRKRASSSTLGLVIEDLANPFYSLVARAVESVARSHDCMLIAVSSEEDPARERELLAALVRRRVDGHAGRAGT